MFMSFGVLELDLDEVSRDEVRFQRPPRPLCLPRPLGVQYIVKHTATQVELRRSLELVDVAPLVNDGAYTLPTFRTGREHNRVATLPVVKRPADRDMESHHDYHDYVSVSQSLVGRW
ncbi:hypothetical protein RRG08_007538 [Elysia crispata]|uniref:Uncharacterized protein n=1 Tax=Elysia crispata TaxID=231223 RepID=A0AAE0YF29_9GAST|nr:hypothetical protein RRG08_007538 [Elysia crispata]